MDVTVDGHYSELKERVEKEWGKFDILVHSLAFADREDLKVDFNQTSREGFKLACDISAFSGRCLCHHLKRLNESRVQCDGDDVLWFCQSS